MVWYGMVWYGMVWYSGVPNKRIVPNKSIGWQIAQI